MTAGSKSELLSRLLNLQVWGVQAIKLTQEVNGVKIIENADRVLFNDAENTNLEIYFPIKDSQNPIVDFELSKEFIRYCGVADHNLQTLVLPIIQYPHKDIEKLLEDYGLDESDDDDEKSTKPPKSVSEENDNESDPVLQSNVGTISLSRTPSPDTDILDQDQDLPASKPSFLRDRIPELDQSIAAVREGAILPSTTPTWIITPSRRRTNASLSIHSTSGDMHGIQHSIGGNDLLAPGNFKEERTQSAPSTIERGTENIPNALDFANFNSEFSKVFEIDTPSQNRQTGSTQHHSVLRYSRRPQTARMQPDPESTIQGIQRHKIGFLGETFVSVAVYALSVSLNIPLTISRLMRGFLTILKTTGTLLVIGQVETEMFYIPSPRLRRKKVIIPTSLTQTPREILPGC